MLLHRRTATDVTGPIRFTGQVNAIFKAANHGEVSTLAPVKRHWAVPTDLVLVKGIDPGLFQHDKLDALYEHGLIDGPPTGHMIGLPTYR